MTRKFVIGIDFGDTYSDVAFCVRPAIDVPISRTDVKRIDTYPGEPARKNKSDLSPAEVPTQSWYEPDGTIKYGFEARNRAENATFDDVKGCIHVEEIKMFLDYSGKSAKKQQKLQDLIQTLAKSPTDIITDYLRFLLVHTRQILAKREKYCNQDTVELVFTIPATWKRAAVRDMQRAIQCAVEQSGFGFIASIVPVTEPKAAAIYTLEVEDEFTVELNDKILICDAGGGTVDFIVYQAVSESPLRLDQVIPTDGDSCGSTFIDDAFSEFLEGLLKEYKTYLEHVQKRPWAKIARSFRSKFESEMKRTYHLDKQWLDSLECVGLPDIKEKGFKNGRIWLTGDLMFSFFLPQMEKIWEIMKSQILGASSFSSRVQKAIVVGGFAESRCLCSYLEEKLKTLDCKFFSPYTADIAVAAGSVLHHIRQIEGPTEILDTNYAVKRHEEFQSRVHRFLKTHTDDMDGKKYVVDCVYYFARVGDKIPSEGKEYSLDPPNLRENFNSLEEDLVIDLEILSSHDRALRKNNLPSTHAQNTSCEILDTIYFTLSSNKLKSLNLERQSRMEGEAIYYYQIDYEPVIHIRDQNLHCQILFRDEVVATGTYKI